MAIGYIIKSREEKEIKINNGDITLGTGLKMSRLIDRIEFIYCKYTKKSIGKEAAWDCNIKQTINLRNSLVHPKSTIMITY